MFLVINSTEVISVLLPKVFLRYGNTTYSIFIDNCGLWDKVKDKLVERKEWLYIPGIFRAKRIAVKIVSRLYVCRLSKLSVVVRCGNISNLFSYLKNYYPKQHTGATNVKSLKEKQKVNDNNQIKGDHFSIMCWMNKTLPKSNKGGKRLLTRWLCKKWCLKYFLD